MFIKREILSAFFFACFADNAGISTVTSYVILALSYISNAYGLEVAFSDFVFFSTAYLGASKIITEENQPALFILGGVMLSAYGFLSFVKTQQKKNKIKKGKAINKKNLISFPIKGFLLNIINVAVLFFWTGLLFVIGPSFEMNPIKIWTFFLLTVATYLLVNLCKFYLASRLKSKLTDTFLFKIKQALNILIFVCGAFFVFKGI